jgi:4-hydroxythreonine-4-phosphate dehydrogenase
MGFDRGVTLIGGFPFPICTPAHGTAYEIAGRGWRRDWQCREALSLAIRMGAEVRARRSEAEEAPRLSVAHS